MSFLNPSENLIGAFGDRIIGVGVFSLAVGLTILGYIYSPSSIFVDLFYLSFAGLAGFGIWLYNFVETRKSAYYILVLAGFFTTVAGLRAFVGVAGIGTPRSVGSIGPLIIEQLWIGGIHIHHYFLGPLFLAWGYFRYKGENRTQSALLYGVGLGFLMDEMGIILAGPPYYNLYSYPAIILTQIILVFLILSEKIDIRSE